MADDKIIIELGVTGNAEVQIKKVSKAVDDLASDGQKNLDKFSGAFDVFAGVIGGAAVIGAFKAVGAAAAELFQTLISDGVRAAQEQEDAINQLNQALIASGEYSQKTSSSLQDFATELQATTKFADEAVLSAAALIENMGNLDKEGLQRATRAAVNLSAALGIDLETAARKVGAAAEGNVTALKKYTGAVEEGQTKAETFANVLDKLESKFGGAAASQVNTYSGSIALLTNQFGEVQEQIGNAIIKNQSLVNVIKVAGEIVQEFEGYLAQNQTTFSSLVSNGIVLAVDGLIAFTRTLDVMLTPIKVAIAGVQNLGDTLGATAAASVAAAQGNFKGAMEIIAETVEKNSERSRIALVGAFTGESGLTKVDFLLQRIGKAAEEGLGKTTDETNKLADSSRNATAAVNELTEAEKKLGEEGAKLAEQAALRDPAAEFQKRLDALNAAAEQEKITVAERDAAIDVYRQEAAQKDSDAILKKEQEFLAVNQANLDSDKFTQQERVRLNVEALKTILENEKLTAKDRAKIQKDLVTLQNTQEQQRYQAASDSLNQLASLQTAKSKELAAIGKAAAIAQTTIDTYRGATGAAAALSGIPIVGPALGIAAAAAFITAGLARVAQIAGVPLATGGEIPPGFPNDSFPARLQSGENVVDKSTNDDLKSFLASSNAMIPLLQAIAAGVQNSQAHVTIVVGTKTIFDSVVEGLQDGRVLQV